MPSEDHDGDARQHRSRLGRPYRRLRRWARHTPNGTIALNLISLGLTLVFIAVLIALLS